MKKIKVSIQDANTLMILEDAQNGDIIDLSSIHETDIDKTTIDNIIKIIKTEEFNSQLEAAKRSIEKEKNLKQNSKSKKLLIKQKRRLLKKIRKLRH